MKWVLRRETLFLLTIFVLGEIMGFALGFHYALSEYDVLMHFIGGALVSSFLLNFCIQYLHKFYFAGNILITMGIGAIWEIIEFLLDRIFALNTQPSLGDTMIDLIIVLFAATAMNAIYWFKNRGK